MFHTSTFFGGTNFSSKINYHKTLSSPLTKWEKQSTINTKKEVMPNITCKPTHHMRNLICSTDIKNLVMNTLAVVNWTITLATQKLYSSDSLQSKCQRKKRPINFLQQSKLMTHSLSNMRTNATPCISLPHDPPQPVIGKMQPNNNSLINEHRATIFTSIPIPHQHYPWAWKERERETGG